MRLSQLLTIAPLVSNVLAQTVSNCVTGGICYRVNVPAATASSGSGDIFIQVTGPSSLSWMGIGQGSSMSGANIFMIYANSAGNNVTISPRLGTGQRQPSTSGATSQITLLAGSGISNGEITANFKCSNCNSWSGGSMSFTDSSSNWIWAYRSGQAISSDSLSVSLSEHSQYGTMNLNLQTGTGGSSVNPFVVAGSSTTSASTPSSTGSSGSSSGSTGSTGSTSNQSSSSGSVSRSTAILIAHAVLMSVAFVVLYPLGALLIRLLSFRGLVWFHAGWMIFTYLIILAGMGLGVWIARNKDLLSHSHAIIGLVVVAALILQPFTGFVHHKIFKSKGGPSGVTYGHVWWGRAVITLGIINGGLGLQLADNTKNGVIAYGVVAGVMWVLWMAAVVFKKTNKGSSVEGNISNSSNEKMNQPSRQQNESLRESYSETRGVQGGRAV